jgi:hypothetical protein
MICVTRDEKLLNTFLQPRETDSMIGADFFMRKSNVGLIFLPESFASIHCTKK